MSYLTQGDIDALRRLLQYATPLPWDNIGDVIVCVMGPPREDVAGAEEGYDVTPPLYDGSPYSPSSTDHTQYNKDCALIATGITCLPDLLEEVAQLRAEVEALRVERDLFRGALRRIGTLWDEVCRETGEDFV